MLRKVTKAGSQSRLTKRVIHKAKTLFKNEKEAYQNAFLAQSRQVLLPFLQRGVFPNEDEEKELMDSIYADVNDLY
jgi:hypothetical protein